MRRILTLALLLVNTFIVFGQYDSEITRLDSLFTKAISDWDVPGMGIAIIHNDHIFTKGYGVKDINTKTPVDANTLFAVASNSKAFTASSIAILVDEGKLSWDDKVVEHLPWFQLYDPYVTANMTIRDLLSHRSGLATFSGDLLWYGTTHSQEEVVKRARHLKPVYGFRTKYGYSNIMYLAAGLIIEKVSGKSWGEFVKENFFKPLEMSSTLTSVTQFTEATNLAMPHTTDNDKTIRIDYLNWDNISPAGSIISSASDMAKWIQLQLNSGKIAGETIISERSLNEMWYPQIMNPVSKGSREIWPMINFRGYGLGWSIMDYYGKKVISHSGGYDGMISYTAFAPEADLGLVILTNKNSSLYLPMFYAILDQFLAPESVETRDWNSFFLERNQKYEESQELERLEAEKQRVANTKPSLDLSKYAGTYTSVLYGDATVSVKEGSLYLQFVPTPMFHGQLKHYHYDTFTVKFPEVPSLPQGTVNFVLDAEGDVEQMKVNIENPDFDFTELEFRK